MTDREYEKIPEHVLWFAKCHYCGISNPVFSSGPLPVTNMEISEKKFFVCDQCMKKNNANNQRG